MKKVTKIHAAEAPKAKRLLRVAAYCRVSTDSDAQLESLATQRQHYETYISGRDDWEFAGLYYDEGISGTNAEHRPELLRMIADCEAGKIDLVLTKSISRLSRNTIDCLGIVRRLLDLSIPIYFEKENLNTGSMESELFLSILSSMAAGESSSISQNSRWSIQRRFQNGTFKIAYPPYGYDWDGDRMVINEEQAETVRWIYEQVLSGMGTDAIAAELNRRKVPARKGGRWHSNAVRGIVANEKYTGDVIFQKSYTDAQFHRHRNHGQQDQYVMSEHHEAIISHETYDAAQAVIAQRAVEKGIVRGTGKYEKRYCLSGKVICGECGRSFRRRTHTCASGNYVAWCCSTHLEDKEQCSMLYVEDAALKAAFATMMNKLIYASDCILRPYVDGLRQESQEDPFRRVQELQTLLLQNADQRETLTRLMGQGYLDQIVYTEENNALMQQNKAYRDELDRLNRRLNGESSHLQEARGLLRLTERHAPLTAFDEELFNRTVSRIVVMSRHEVVFELKCGLRLRERM